MIRPLRWQDCRRIAEIHVDVRPGDVLPDLGVPFLSALYRSLLKRGGLSAFVCEESDQVVGFVIGCARPGETMKATLLASWLPLTFHALARCLQRPRLIPRVLETFLYGRRRDLSGPELMVIAVNAPDQGRGIGTSLVETLHAAFHAQGFAQCHVAVKAMNAPAIRFYGRLGFRAAQHLSMYGELWSLYESTLTAPPPTTRSESSQVIHRDR